MATASKRPGVDEVEAATSPTAPETHSVLLDRAEETLRAEGLRSANAYRVERRARNRWWAAYERRGNAWTAIFAGELPEDWRLLRTLEGWPVAR
jgi:hypothetical protein